MQVVTSASDDVVSSGEQSRRQDPQDEEETLEMSQQVWHEHDDGAAATVLQAAAAVPEQDCPADRISLASLTRVDVELQSAARRHSDDDMSDELPQYDGPGDEKMTGTHSTVVTSEYALFF